MKSRRKRAWRQRGQAMTEYIVVVAVLLGVFAAPLVPDPQTNSMVSIFYLFVRTFDIYIDSFHVVITLPIP